MTDIDDDYVAPKTPFDYISRDQLHDLWGAGFTVIRRNTFGSDVYQIADHVCKAGMAQQWSDELKDGWTAVLAERHPGLYAPYSYAGDVKIGGLMLLECPKHKVDAARSAQVDAAHKLVTDWQDKYGGQFSGTVTVGTQTKLGELDTVETMEVGSKTIEDTTKIPHDMVPYIAAIFDERDYLAKLYTDDRESGEPEWSTVLISQIADQMDDAMRVDPGAPKWPILNAIILPHAIENVRRRITEEAKSGQAS